MRHLAVLALITFVGCSADPRSPTDPGTDEPAPEATFSRVQQEIFTPACALSGCHASPAPTQDLDLSPGQAWADLVNVPSRQSGLLRVQPGSAEQSYLVRKVRGDVGITGSRMPRGAAPLTEEQIQLIEDWILLGALDD